MKTREYIENISFEELERIADDQSAEVPGTVRENLKKSVLAAAASQELKSRKTIWAGKSPLYAFAAIAACAVILISVPNGGKNPKDTYSSPELAYAELEKTMNLIAQKMDSGIEKTQQLQEPIDQIYKILDKINE